MSRIKFADKPPMNMLGWAPALPGIGIRLMVPEHYVKCELLGD